MFALDLGPGLSAARTVQQGAWGPIHTGRNSPKSPDETQMTTAIAVPDSGPIRGGGMWADLCRATQTCL